MEWLNYQQLFYFWVVAREGGLTHAARVLRLSHPTLHAHVRGLEERLEVKLFARQGRRLVLTDAGRVVQRYADEIFSLGREMVDTVRGQAPGMVPRLQVGVVDGLPKLVVRELLEPVRELSEPVRIVCSQGTYEHLLAELSLHRLDVVLADAPIPPGSNVRAFHHLLGQCGVGLFAVPELAKKIRRRFPESLRGAPMLLPLERLPLRRALDQWMTSLGVVPNIVAELGDSALLKVFGATGIGVFPAPLAVADEVCRQYGVQLIGQAGDIEQRFYVITLERKLHSPAVLALWQAARSAMFSREAVEPKRARKA
jgi:LysR family transcriptional activator of nhaA